jgi:DNA-binding NarL/FixJ family response regulator
LQITAAERAALQLLADGRTKPEIASRLRVDERDVETWLAALSSRMDCATALDAATDAVRRGLLRLDEHR